MLNKYIYVKPIKNSTIMKKLILALAVIAATSMIGVGYKSGAQTDRKDCKNHQPEHNLD